MGDPSRSFVPKGHQLRRRCAQIKLQEHYLIETLKNGVHEHTGDHGSMSACLLCLQGRSVVPLPSASTNEIIVPSFECLQHLLPIVSALPVLQNTVVLILQTVLRQAIDTANRQLQLQYKSLLFDTSNATRIILLNEMSTALYSHQRDQQQEACSQHQFRLVIDTCEFLRGFLGFKLTLLASDENDPLYGAFLSRRLEVTTVHAYLTDSAQRMSGSQDTTSKLVIEAEETLSHVRQQAAHRKAEQAALASSLQEQHRLQGGLVAVSKATRRLFSPHVSPSQAAAGLSDGSCLRGKLCILKHNSQEGEVEVSKGAGAGVVVVVSGWMDLNRALDGDLVVVRMHPRSQWRAAAVGDVVLCPPEVGADTADADADPDASPDLEREREGGGGAGVDVAAHLSAMRSVTSSSSSSSGSGSGSGSGSSGSGSSGQAERTIMTGEIIAITQRSLTETVATVPARRHPDTLDNPTHSPTDSPIDSPTDSVREREEYVLLPPLDRRIPKVRIRTRQRAQLGGQRVLVAIDDWPLDSHYPNGHLVRVIGSAQDWQTEIECLLLRHSIFPRWGGQGRCGFGCAIEGL